MEWFRVCVIALLLLLQGVSAFLSRQRSTGGVGTLEHTATEPTRRSVAFLPRQAQQPSFSLIEPKKTVPSRRQTTSSLQAITDSDDSSSNNNPVRIIIAGAPASGKGTQCERIKEKFGVVHLSTGDMLRAAVAAGTDVGKEAQSYMESGKLVPDSVIIGVVKDRLEQEDCQTRGWLLDGFPRTQAQAKALEDAGITADCFVFLNVPDEALVERVVGRRTDPETGKIYHMTFSPPDDDKVLSRLEQRTDDTEEKVKVRLEQFHANVEAVKDSYTNISVTIDGNNHPDVVSEKIFDAIGAFVAA